MRGSVVAVPCTLKAALRLARREEEEGQEKKAKIRGEGEWEKDEEKNRETEHIVFQPGHILPEALFLKALRPPSK